MTRSARYRNSEVFYEVTGSGTPVILIHGFGESGLVWRNQIDKLQQIYKLIIPDLPGSGRSSTLDIAVQETSLAEFSNCINLILEKENITSCVMLGHSMGGYIMLDFAEKHSEK